MTETTCPAACRVPPESRLRECTLPAGHRCDHLSGPVGAAVVWEDNSYTINPFAIEVVRLSDGRAAHPEEPQHG